MSATLREFANQLLGLELRGPELGFHHMAWRAFVVICFSVLLVRLADRRLLGHNAGFDIISAIVLGSVLSRAVNGNAAFFPSLGATALLAALHHVIAVFAFRSHRLSQLLKGRARTLVRHGKIIQTEMVRGKITADDLEENLRLNGGTSAVDDVAEARLERNGSISVIPEKKNWAAVGRRDESAQRRRRQADGTTSRGARARSARCTIRPVRG